MKTILFDLSNSWNGVIDFFNEFLKDEGGDYTVYPCIVDVHLVSLFWLSARIYKHAGIINQDLNDITFPFELELALVDDGNTLISLDSRLFDFEQYLIFLDIAKYDFPVNTHIKIVNRVMLISK